MKRVIDRHAERYGSGHCRTEIDRNSKDRHNPEIGGDGDRVGKKGDQGQSDGSECQKEDELHQQGGDDETSLKRFEQAVLRG